MDLVGLAGWAQSGKNEVGVVLEGHDYKQVAFADKLREAIEILNPIVGFDVPVRGMDVAIHPYENVRAIRYLDAKKTWGYEAMKTMFDAEPRRLLQVMGTEVGREFIGPDTWLRPLMAQIDAAPGKYSITDVRFPNEADAIKERGGRVYWISRPGIGPANDHPSEHALDDYDFDAVIDNSGTLDDLAAEARSTILGIN